MKKEIYPQRELLKTLNGSEDFAKQAALKNSPGILQKEFTDVHLDRKKKDQEGPHTQKDHESEGRFPCERRLVQS